MSETGIAPETLAPRENPDLLGHAAAEAAFLDSFKGHRLAHAWLISGPRGIGKATLAFRFARFLLAQPAAGTDLLGSVAAPTVNDLGIGPEHPVFRRVAAAGHADLMTVERGFSDEQKNRRRTEIVVGDARKIAGFLSMTPAEGGWRVVIIDSADEMNRNAANAVLKVLEEPPDRAVLFLVSHNPGSLLPTVRSRCRRLVLTPLRPETVSEIVGRCRPDLAAEDIAVLAALGEGSVGRALALAEEGGIELHRDLMAVLATLPSLDGAALHALAERVARPNAEAAFRTLSDLLLAWLGRLLKTGAGGAATRGLSGQVAERENALAARLLGTGRLDPWLEVWEKISRLLARTDAVNLDRRQVVLNAFLALEEAARR